MDIESIKRRLLIKYPFFGSVVANTSFIEDKNCYSNGIPTLGTDGSNVYYHPDAVASITEDEQVFLFAHEVCHIAFNHILRSEGKDLETWNIATDAVINAFLNQDGLPLTTGSVNMPDAINYDAEEFYEKLLEQKNNSQRQNSNEQNQSGDGENKNNNSQNNQSSSNSNSNQNQIGGSNNSQNSNPDTASKEFEEQSEERQSNRDVGHDTHSMWQKMIDKKNGTSEDSSSPEEQNNDNLENGQQKSDESKQKEQQDLNEQEEQRERQQREKEEQSQNEFQKTKKSEQDKQIDEEIKKITKLGEKVSFKQNRIERKKQLEELRNALASSSHGHGSDTNSERRNISDIGTSSPLIDWRRLLKEAVKYDIDWSYQNASIEDGVVTAHLEELSRPETEIVLDTSGSIDEMLLRNFLRECKNILQTSKVKVGCFDTKFYGFTEIKNVSDIDCLPFYGGGGTNFDVAVNAFTKRVENKIIFTDGDARMPNLMIDAIWIVFGNHKIKPNGGKVIYISEEQLKKLSFIRLENQSKGRTR